MPRNLSATPSVAQTFAIFDTASATKPVSGFIPALAVNGAGRVTIGFTSASADNYATRSSTGRGAAYR